MKFTTYSPLLMAAALSSVISFASTGVTFGHQTNDAQPPEVTKHKFFEFDGGNPFDFIKAIDRHFRTRLVQILTLPETLSRVEVPKIRVAAKEPTEVLSLYNRVGNPELGQWRFESEGDTNGSNLGMLTLIPDKSVAVANHKQTITKVQAVPLGDIPTNQWNSLAESIKAASELGEQVGLSNSRGKFYLQKDSKILIVAGPESYIETIVSVVTAYRGNTEIEAQLKAASSK